jgi:enterochelin esterase family protein
MKRLSELLLMLSLICFLSGRTIMAASPEKEINSKKYFNKNENFLFDLFRADLHSSNNKEQFIKEFLEFVEKGKYPLFENDSAYVLFYKGEKDSAGVLGDMSNWSNVIPMERIDNTDLYFLRGNAEPDARFEYWLMFGKNSFPALDSMNPYKSLNGFGELSELVMPLYKRHPYFDEYIYGKKGESEGLKVHIVKSAYLGYEHTIHVFLPPDYDSSKTYPAVYFQDGIDYVEFGQVPVILNSLIKEGKINPLIAVFVTPPNRLKSGMPNRMTEYGLNDNYVKFFTDELVPFMDSTYAASKDPHKRLVTGDSFGGLISAYITFSRPDVFANGYSQSGYQSFSKDKLINLFRSEEKKDINLYVDTGIYERTVGTAFLPLDEADFLMANRRFKKVLGEKSYKFIYREYPEGHAWGNWKRHLIDALEYFFPEKSGAGK